MKRELLTARAKNLISALKDAPNPESIVTSVLLSVHQDAIEEVAQNFIKLSKNAGLKSDAFNENFFISKAHEVRYLKAVE